MEPQPDESVTQAQIIATLRRERALIPVDVLDQGDAHVRDATDWFAGGKPYTDEFILGMLAGMRVALNLAYGHCDSNALHAIISWQHSAVSLLRDT